MVRCVFILIFSFLFGTGAADTIFVHLPPKVSVSVTGNTAYEMQPINCVVTIIHDKSQVIDQSSFRYHDAPLQMHFVGETEPGSTALFKPNDPRALVVTTFQFTLPPRPKGLYVIDPIYVKVGNIPSSSTQVTYAVVSPNTNNLLHLEAKMMNTGKLYPGQHVTFQYTIIFQNIVNLTKENLPLLALDTFQTIGAPKVHTFAEGDHTVQTIAQEAIPTQAGKFSVGESFIEGNVYQQDDAGQRTGDATLARATAPGFTIEVQPFPQTNKPSSFTGAIGKFQYELHVTTKEIYVGEPMQLALTVSGSGELDSVTLPISWLQEQLLSQFHLSKIAPTGEIQDRKKLFILELFPNTTDIHEIPPLEFSSFDPDLGIYYKTKTKPIAITVLPSKNQEKPENTQKRASRIEIYENVPITTPATPFSFKMSSLMNITLLTVIFLCFEYGLIQVWRRRKQEHKTVQSHDILLQAITRKNQAKEALTLIQTALLLRLFEIKETNEILEHPESLSSNGLQGDIKKFLLHVNEKRFSGTTDTLTMQDIIEQASELYHRTIKSA